MLRFRFLSPALFFEIRAQPKSPTVLDSESTLGLSISSETLT